MNSLFFNHSSGIFDHSLNLISPVWAISMSHRLRLNQTNKLTLNCIHPEQLGNIIVLMRRNHEINWSCLMNHIKRFWNPNIQILDRSQNFFNVMRYDWINPLSTNNLKWFFSQVSSCCPYNIGHIIWMIFYGHIKMSLLPYNRNSRQPALRLSKMLEAMLKPSF